MLLQLLAFYLRLNKPKMSKFKVWTKLEDVRTEIDKAVETNDALGFAELVYCYVSTALSVPEWVLDLISWNMCLFLYKVSVGVNRPKPIPLLTSDKSKKEKPVGWDYKGRRYFYWSHLLASTYGWNKQQIDNLETDVALAYIMEIVVDQQLEKEFAWSLSEIAYPYDKATNKSVYKPLERPYFMLEEAPKPKKMMIPKALVPIGVVQDESGMVEYFEKQKASESQRDGTGL